MLPPQLGALRGVPALASSLQRFPAAATVALVCHERHAAVPHHSSPASSATTGGSSLGCPHHQHQQRLFRACTLTEASSSASTSGSVASTATDDVPLAVARLRRLKTNFCSRCGSAVHIIKPPGEREWRHQCSNSACAFIDYVNPKMVVGCIVEHQGKILLCRRAIEPCKGLWTLPAGYMELHESSAEGAARETMEEANAQVQVLAPYAHWDLPSIGQAYILFRAALQEPYTFSPGPETLETAMVAPEDIPWGELAFSSITITLRHYVEDMAAGRGFRFHHGVIDKKPGAGPNDFGTYDVRHHMAMYTASPS